MAATLRGGTFGSSASWLGLTIQRGRRGPQAPHLGLDFLGRPAHKQLLRVQAAKEGDLPSEFTRQALGVHVPGPGLERMEAVHARLDQPGDDPVDRTAGMEDDLVSAAMGLVGEFPEPGQDERVEVGRADQAVDLRPEIVAEEIAVDEPPACLKNRRLASR